MDASLQIQTRVDMSSPAVVSTLSAMATGHPQNVAQPVVQILSPVFIHVIPNNTQQHKKVDASMWQQESLELLESFMTEWSTFIGDPILSKWIIIVLIVSVLLNGYLLKGLATLLFVSFISPPPGGVMFASFTDGLDAKQLKQQQSTCGRVWFFASEDMVQQAVTSEINVHITC